MAAKLRVLIDLNIVLDTLQRREPFYAASAGVLACAETGRVDGLVAAHTLTTLFYLMAKSQSPDQARVVLTERIINSGRCRCCSRRSSWHWCETGGGPLCRPSRRPSIMRTCQHSARLGEQ